MLGSGKRAERMGKRVQKRLHTDYQRRLAFRPFSHIKRSTPYGSAADLTPIHAFTQLLGLVRAFERVDSTQ